MFVKCVCTRYAWASSQELRQYVLAGPHVAGTRGSVFGNVCVREGARRGGRRGVRQDVRKGVRIHIE